MNANDKITVGLPAGLVLSLTLTNGTTGFVTRLADIVGNEPYPPLAISGNINLGPFATTRRYLIECLTGTISYSAYVPEPGEQSAAIANGAYSTSTLAAPALLTAAAGLVDVQAISDALAVTTAKLNLALAALRAHGIIAP